MARTPSPRRRRSRSRERDRKRRRSRSRERRDPRDDRRDRKRFSSEDHVPKDVKSEVSLPLVDMSSERAMIIVEHPYVDSFATLSRLLKRSGEREYRRKSWSRSRSRSTEKQRFKAREQPPKRNITAAELEGKSEEEQEMLKLMGFCDFATTKNHKVEENDAGEVHVILKRKYRQYMNRKGGFNRPLDFVA